MRVILKTGGVIEAIHPLKATTRDEAIEEVLARSRDGGSYAEFDIWDEERRVYSYPLGL